MYFTRSFLKHVTVYEQLFFGDYELNLLDYLKQIYSGTCIDNCYVVDVKKILYYTQPKVNYESTIILMSMVEFEAETIIFLSGDYVLCTVIQSDSYIICDWKNILTCNIKQNINFKGLTPGDIIPVVLNNISYYDKKILAGGDILTHVPLFTTIYNIVKDDVSSAAKTKKDANTDTSDTPVKLLEKSKHFYNVLKKLSHGGGGIVLTKKYDVGSFIKFNDLDKDKLILYSIKNADIFITVDINSVESTIINNYNKLVTFLNEFELEKKIKLLYDNLI